MGQNTGLNNYGIRALAHFVDPNSDFRRHTNIEKNVRTFGDDAQENVSIYHYTSISALKNILKSGYFRITQANSMNDPDEFKWASQRAITYLRSKNATTDQVASFKKMIDMTPFRDNYIWSFSKNEDSETLFHIYGVLDGIALEFGEKDVMTYLAKHNANGKTDFDQFDLGNAYTFPLTVLYDAEKQIEYIKPLVDEWLDVYRGIGSDTSHLETINRICVQNLFLFDMCFKNPKLSHEEEFRFVSVRKNDGTIQPELKVGNVQYINFRFNPSLIKSITLRPNCSVSKDQFREMFKEYKLNAVVKNSTLPY